LTDGTNKWLNDQIKTKWKIEITPLFKRDNAEATFEEKYSISKKTFVDDNLTESESITVSRRNLLQLKDKIDSILNECM
jgi:hypothetical protein